jgi:thiamine biosynthesis protein ThiS
MPEIRVNGKPRAIGTGATLGELLDELHLDARWIVAELNGEPLPRERLADVALADGDRLELVRPVAGG